MMQEKIDKLRAYFSSHQDIVIAFVFGSYAKNQQTEESDLDVALYFKPQTKSLEWEEVKTYPAEGQIWSDVEKITGMRTDLIVLNRAPATLACTVLREGIPLIIKDRYLYIEFLLIISQVAEDFQEFIKDFYLIKQRSQSLNPVDEARLIRIVDFLEAELKDYPNFKGLNRIQYETDSALRRNVERWVENIVNASIDIAKILLAAEKKRIPQTYRLALQELSLLENFSSEIAEKLARLTRLRNILAHEYVDIRFQQISEFIQESEPVYLELVHFIKSFLI